MSDLRTITITLPEPAFRKLQRAAELTYRSMDEILSNVINAALIAEPDLPPELAEELGAMHLFSDEALWAAARPSLSPAEQERLRQLNEIAGERTLSAAEAAEQSRLLEAYQRAVLRRAQALAILKQRGHPIAPERSMFSPES